MIVTSILALTMAGEPLRPAVRPVRPREARWTNGFPAERFNALHKTGLPAMTRLMTGTERSQVLVNLEIAAGKRAGTHRGPAWNDGDYYKWLEAAAAVEEIEFLRQLIGTGVGVGAIIGVLQLGLDDAGDVGARRGDDDKRGLFDDRRRIGTLGDGWKVQADKGDTCQQRCQIF